MSNFLERLEIGNTGLTSSRLGIGSTFDASTAVIEDAFDRGINYLYWGTVRQPDFARAMVNLSKNHRDELVLTVQSYSQDPSSICLLYTSPSPRDLSTSRMPSSA